MSNQITPNEVVVIQMALGATIEDIEAMPKGTLNKVAENELQEILISAKSALVKIAQVSGKLVKMEPYKEGDEKEFMNEQPVDLPGLVIYMGYIKEDYGYKRVTKEITHWVTFYKSGEVNMYGYYSTDPDFEKKYDTGILKEVVLSQLEMLIRIFTENHD